MTKLFVLSNAVHRLRDDFFTCGTHDRRPPCSSCGANLNGWSAPLLYWWEYEFGDPQSALDAGHNCYWGGFRLMVDQVGRSMLDTLAIPFTFHPARMKKGEPLVEQQASLTYVTIDASIDANPVACKNAVCSMCGRFTERKCQITRLRLSFSDVPDFGVFTIRQNGRWGPMFVTEDARANLTATGINGIGFYPAGRLVQ